MKNQKENYYQEILVSTTAINAFASLTKHINLWWGNTDKIATKVDDEFTVNFDDANWSFRVTEFELNSKLTWECIGGNPDFNAEWIGDTLHWNIEEDGDNVKISLLQNGLTPDMNCFEICNRGWNHYITKSLQAYLETGNGILEFVG
jgi:hypothetical protein